MISNEAFANVTALNQCEPYHEIIVNILNDEGVSSDYYFLAVCESKCKIKESSKGARGIFQIMPSTFKKYSSDDCSDIDDIICNTKAASRYLKHLINYKKDFETTIQMYNQGGRNRIKNGPTKEAIGLSYCVISAIKEYETYIRSSYVIYDSNGACSYWYYEDEPDKRNPCGSDDSFVPENAKRIDDE